MTNQETLELALNALKCLFGLPDKFTGKGGDVAVWRLGGSYRAQEAITALEEALAKQEQEPVAYIHRNEYNEYRLEPHDNFDIKSIPFNIDVPLFKSPQRTWVGLTDEETKEIQNSMVYGNHPFTKVIAAIENKLKEKNT